MWPICVICATGDQIERVLVVPPVAAMMVKNSQCQKYRLPHLRDLLISGAAMKADTEDLLLKKFPRLQLRQGIFHVLHQSRPTLLWARETEVVKCCRLPSIETVPGLDCAQTAQIRDVKRGQILEAETKHLRPNLHNRWTTVYGQI